MKECVGERCDVETEGSAPVEPCIVHYITYKHMNSSDSQCVQSFSDKVIISQIYKTYFLKYLGLGSPIRTQKLLQYDDTKSQKFFNCGR